MQGYTERKCYRETKIVSGTMGYQKMLRNYYRKNTWKRR